MNKKIIIGIVVVLLVAGGIYWYVESQNNGGGTAPYEAANTPATTPVTTPTSTASPSSTTTSSTTPASAPTPTPVLNVMTNATVGTYLVATNGMTLYTYSKDTAGVSNCTGSCATAWPPYTVSGSQTLVAGLNISGGLGTIKQGTNLQLTYKGMPLYFWSGDSKPGDVTGNNLNGFVAAKP